jgi:hypothetical protein
MGGHRAHAPRPSLFLIGMRPRTHKTRLQIGPGGARVNDARQAAGLAYPADLHG